LNSQEDAGIAGIITLHSIVYLEILPLSTDPSSVASDLFRCVECRRIVIANHSDVVVPAEYHAAFDSGLIMQVRKSWRRGFVLGFCAGLSKSPSVFFLGFHGMAQNYSPA
jgi:hypothetical protein